MVVFLWQSWTTKFHLTLLKIPLNSHKNRNHPVNWPFLILSPPPQSQPPPSRLFNFLARSVFGTLQAPFPPPTLPKLLAPGSSVKWLFPTSQPVSESFRTQRRSWPTPLWALHKAMNPLPRGLQSPGPKWHPDHPASSKLPAKLQIHHFQMLLVPVGLYFFIFKNFLK